MTYLPTYLPTYIHIYIYIYDSQQSKRRALAVPLPLDSASLELNPTSGPAVLGTRTWFKKDSMTGKVRKDRGKAGGNAGGQVGEQRL